MVLKNLFLLILLVVISHGFILAQPVTTYVKSTISEAKPKLVWYNIQTQEFPVLHGQAWRQECAGTFGRLPLRAKEKVRPELWALSQQSAGLSVRFYTNASKISIRYTVAGIPAFPHMSATGVSGLDLYTTDKNGKTLWCAGNYSFGDTIRYTYNNLTSYSDMSKGREYKLFLPLYNQVKWMEIGVDQDTELSWIPPSGESPIVVYGTSIAQGACSSRPGMAWTSILDRELGHPLINLGFSGNGLLEPDFIDLMTEIDAKLYILDCLPNLAERNNMDVEKVIINAVMQIRSKRQAPVLLVEHAGYGQGLVDKTKYETVENANHASRSAYETLINNGIKNLFYLSTKEINMPMDGMVDGIHPTDWGMRVYADAYEKIIRKILNESTGDVSTTQPCTQRRDFPIYEWKKRHEEILSLSSSKSPRQLLIGNSITHYWGGEPLAPRQNGKKSWDELMEPKGTLNLGFGWDRIENVLWRVYHGELDGYKAENIYLWIGTNNLETNTDQEIVTGIECLAKAIEIRQPQAKLYIVGILPRRNLEKRISMLNTKIKAMANKLNHPFMDLSPLVTSSDGKIIESLFLDGLHPNEKGYQLIGEKLSRN
jgi:lysophospholipase L1-like esterase